MPFPAENHTPYESERSLEWIAEEGEDDADGSKISYCGGGYHSSR